MLISCVRRRLLALVSLRAAGAKIQHYYCLQAKMASCHPLQNTLVKRVIDNVKIGDQIFTSDNISPVRTWDYFLPTLVKEDRFTKSSMDQVREFHSGYHETLSNLQRN